MTRANDRSVEEEAYRRFHNTLAGLQGLCRRYFAPFEDPQVQAVARTLELQIQACASLNRTLMLARAPGEGVDAPSYFTALCADLTRVLLAPRNISCHLLVDEGELPQRACQALALIVVELVTNAAKHGFIGRAHGRVGVAVRRTARGWVCVVQDNGRGLTKAAADKTGPGQGGAGGSNAARGGRLIAALARSFGGEARVASDACGVTVTIWAPDRPEMAADSAARRPAQ
jgi:two-component sensor histidine kinase